MKYQALAGLLSGIPLWVELLRKNPWIDFSMSNMVHEKQSIVLEEDKIRNVYLCFSHIF